MGASADALRYAVRFRVLIRHFGTLCLVLGSLYLVPLTVALIFRQHHACVRYLIIIGSLGVVGFLSSRVRAPKDVQPNEGMALVAIIYLFSPMVAAVSLMELGLSFDSALFEAISGITTSGLTMVTEFQNADSTLLFARSWLHWYGGLGIMIFSLALLTQPGPAAKGLAVSDAETEDIVGGMRDRARRAVKVYGIITLFGVLGSLAIGTSFFDSILFTFSSVSTGSFAPYSENLGALPQRGQIWFIVLCIAGSLPLMFYARALWKPKHAAVDRLQAIFVVICGLGASFLLTLTLHLFSRFTVPSAIHHGFLLAFSAQTTSGFETTRCAELDIASKIVLMFPMLIGAGSGSTAGGIKIFRLMILLKVIHQLLLRTCLPPHAFVEPRLAGRRLEVSEIQTALAVILLYFAVMALSWLPFLIMGYPAVDSLFEVVSLTSNTGLSAGIAKPDMPLFLKGILCADMLLGRIEILAWLVLFYPRTWIGTRKGEK